MMTVSARTKATWREDIEHGLFPRSSSPRQPRESCKSGKAAADADPAATRVGLRVAPRAGRARGGRETDAAATRGFAGVRGRRRRRWRRACEADGASEIVLLRRDRPVRA